MDLLPSAPLIPDDDSRARQLADLHAALRVRFVAFTVFWALKVVLGAFGGFGTLTPFHEGTFTAWALASWIALAGMTLSFALFGDSAIRSAHAMGKDRVPFWVYFTLAPMAAILFPRLGAVPFGFFIYNAILGSPIAVYLLLAGELEEEVQTLTAIR